MILLHGGCFLKQYEGFAQTSTLAADLAAPRLCGLERRIPQAGRAGAGYPGTFQDVATAIDALRAEAPKYGLDLKRVIAVGHSAGGHLALWAASRSEDAGRPARSVPPIP